MSLIDGILDAIQMHRDPISAATDADDPVTEDLVVTILSDEEAHRTAFRGFKREYKQD